MFNLTISTMIDAPIQRVFDYMSTPENNIQWQYGILSSTTVASRHNSMGVYFRNVGHFLGHRNLGTYQVIEDISNRKYRFKSLSGPLHLHTTYTFNTVGEATKVNISMHVSTINFFHMNERTLGRRMKQQMKENLAALKSLLEMKQVPTIPGMNLPAM